jgi:hypothetical protein
LAATESRPLFDPVSSNSGPSTVNVGCPRCGRDSLLRWAAGARREQLDTARERQQHDEARARARAAQHPPSDGYVWINMDAAAAVLKVTRARVGQLTRADRLPHIRRGRRVYYRRDLIEQISAARAARKNRSLGF